MFHICTATLIFSVGICPDWPDLTEEILMVTFDLVLIPFNCHHTRGVVTLLAQLEGLGGSSELGVSRSALEMFRLQWKKIPSMGESWLVQPGERLGTAAVQRPAT